MVSEPGTPAESQPEVKFHSPSIERKISVVDPPNLSDLSIPLEVPKPEERKVEKKISRFLVSPVVDKPLEEPSASNGPLPVDTAAPIASQNTVSVPDETPTGVQEAMDATTVDKPLRRHSSTQQAEVPVSVIEVFE